VPPSERIPHQITNQDMCMRIGLAILFFAATPLPLAAQQVTTRGNEAAAAVGSEGSAEAAFNQIFAEWSAALKELQAVRVKFQSASEAERPALQQQFMQLMPKARQLAPKMIAAAEQAYIEAPNKSEHVAQFLLRVAVDNLRTDNYEEANRVAKILVAGNTPEKRIYLLAGLAAFNVNEFDVAEKNFSAAAQAGLLDPSKAEELGLSTALINQATQNMADLDSFRRLWAAEQKIRSAEAQADDLPRVKLQTTKGDIVLELFENEAPNAVANFISLVEKGFYDGLSFHRVLPGFMAQGGCPRGDGTGGPGYHIACECHEPNFRRHFRGSLSMAHAGRDTGGSQFFLTFVRTTHLDGKHTAFGRVVEGMDVLGRLMRIDPSRPGPQPTPDKIIKATVVRKRPHEYRPKTLPAPGR
jgi:cyclophilin family peptidyl-prolyl cis-trans isomerase